ncbi:MAG: low temperature requirement protein A [Solirubrobacteraceae bacterium]
MTPAVRRRIDQDDEEQRATTLELFYDLVFVFAITQVSHTLLEHLTWAGAGQAAIVLLAVHWSWNFTTWVTNELDPDVIHVRILLLVLMLLSLLLAIAIPEAFGGRALLFAVSYVAIQVLRHGFLTFVAADAGTNERERAGRILTWFVFAGIFWIGGALVGEGSTRTVLWVAALVIDYGGALLTFWVPGRPKLDGTSWEVTAPHMAERFQAFVIIALGESIVVTGATAAGHELDVPTATALVLAFLGTAAFWWLYFTSVGRIAEDTLLHARDQTMLTRDVYTFLHVVLIAGIVVSAVGDEVVLAHPKEELGTPELVALVAGPVLYFFAQLLIKFRVMGEIGWTRVAAIVACIAAGAVGTTTAALVPAALLALVGCVLIAADEHQMRSHFASEPALEG